MNKESLISFIIPVLHYQRPLNKKRFFMPSSNIKNLLDDLSQNVSVPFEIIVICNSTDPILVEFISKSDLIDKKIFLNMNSGVPRSWNIGANFAESKYLCFVSDDVRVGEYATEKIIEVLESDESVGEAGPKGDLYKDGLPLRYVGQDKEEFSDVISGFFFITRQNVYKTVGGFDNFYSPAGYEEVDFSFAVRAHGWKCKVVPNLNIKHNEYHGVSAFRTNIKYLGQEIDTHTLHERNKEYFMKKWGY